MLLLVLLPLPLPPAGCCCCAPVPERTHDHYALHGFSERNHFKARKMRTTPVARLTLLGLGLLLVAAAAAHAPVAAAAQLQLTTAKISALAGGKTSRASTTASFPGSFAETLAVDDNDHLEVALSVGSVTPDQAVLRVSPTSATKPTATSATPTSTSGEFYASLGPDGSGTAGALKTLVAVSKMMEPLAYTSGTYDLTLVVSGPAGVAPKAWKLGVVAIKFSRAGPEAKKLPHFTRHLLYESDTTIVALPEIHHQFRPADRRAPVVIAFGFAGVIVALLLGFLLMVAHLGFAGSVVRAIAHPIVLLVGAFLALYLWYWVGVKAPNFINLSLYYLSPLGSVLAFFLVRHAARGSSASAAVEKQE